MLSSIVEEEERTSFEETSNPPSFALSNSDDDVESITYMKDLDSYDQVDSLQQAVSETSTVGRPGQWQDYLKRKLHTMLDRIIDEAKHKDEQDEILQKAIDMVEGLRHLTRFHVAALIGNENKVDDESTTTHSESLLDEFGDCDGIRAKLSTALEGKRLAELRITDLKAHIDSIEQTRALPRKISDEDYIVESPQHLVERLTEERNMLLNRNEGNEVLWRNKQEEKAIEHQVAFLELKQQHEAEVQALQDELVILKQQLHTQAGSNSCPQSSSTAVGSECSREMVSDDLGSRNPSLLSTHTDFPWLQRVTTWLGALACPSRIPRALAPAPVEPSADSFLQVQDVVWKLLKSIASIIGFCCATKGLLILEATSKAFQTFGQRVEHGHSLVGLLGNADMAGFLRRAILTQQRLAENAYISKPAGFDLSNVGSLQFVDRCGQLLRCTVLVAHFSLPPKLQTDATCHIIVDPESTSRLENSEADEGDRQKLSRPWSNFLLGNSDTNSVAASDSASNLGEYTIDRGE